ncbi:hypothetical protein FRB97_000435 [Tulasnella sp. 331]|nr:hypothetical protein FRB97_000435 [Tulasnella sp. 331]
MSGSQWTPLSRRSDSSDGIEELRTPDVSPSISRTKSIHQQSKKRKESPLRTVDDARKAKTSRAEAETWPVRLPTSSRLATDLSGKSSVNFASPSRPRPRPKTSPNASRSTKTHPLTLASGRASLKRANSPPMRSARQRARSPSIHITDDEEPSPPPKRLADKEIPNPFSRSLPSQILAKVAKPASRTAMAGSLKVFDITSDEDSLQASKIVSESWISSTAAPAPQPARRGSESGQSSNSQQQSSGTSSGVDGVHDRPRVSGATTSNQSLLGEIEETPNRLSKRRSARKVTASTMAAPMRRKSHILPTLILDPPTDASNPSSIDGADPSSTAPSSARVHNVTEGMGFLGLAEELEDSPEPPPAPPVRLVTPSAAKPLFLPSDEDMDKGSCSVENVTGMMEQMSSPYRKKAEALSSGEARDSTPASPLQKATNLSRPRALLTPAPSSAEVTAEETVVLSKNPKTAAFLSSLKLSSQKNKPRASVSSVPGSVATSPSLETIPLSTIGPQISAMTKSTVIPKSTDKPSSRLPINTSDTLVTYAQPATTLMNADSSAFNSPSVATSSLSGQRSVKPLPAKFNNSGNIRSPEVAGPASRAIPPATPSFVFKAKSSISDVPSVKGPPKSLGLSAVQRSSQAISNSVLPRAGVKKLSAREAPPIAGPSSLSAPVRLSDSAGAKTTPRKAAGSQPLELEADSEPEISLPAICSIREWTIGRGKPWWNPYLDAERPAIPLDGALADSVNNTPPGWEKHPNRRLIFKAMIRNGSEFEDDAPPIDIINEIDDEPCPPFEFQWTNRMLYGKGVPRMDRDLKGCNCVGGCDPTSPDCACAMRQTFWSDEMRVEEPGFMYDLAKQLLYHGVPVFECNAACGCDDHCQNRVVQNGRKVHLSLKKTKYKGWGVFAEEEIPYGTFIGIYSGELLTDEEAGMRGEVYDAFGRTYLFDIDCAHLTRGPQKPSKLINVMAGVPKPKKRRKGKGKGKEPASNSMAELPPVRAQCRCNAPGCVGYIFKHAAIGDDPASLDGEESTDVGSYHTDDD